MKKKHKSLLEQIYDGEFCPCENIIPNNPKYISLKQKISDEIEYISGQLNIADSERFEKLLNIITDAQSMESYANFTYGLRSGISLMLELFTNELYD